MGSGAEVLGMAGGQLLGDGEHQRLGAAADDQIHQGVEGGAGQLAQVQGHHRGGRFSDGIAAHRAPLLRVRGASLLSGDASLIVQKGSPRFWVASPSCSASCLRFLSCSSSTLMAAG